MVSKQEQQRHRLTLTQLASYDDILTDLLVDNVFFWTTIRKNKAKYSQTRGFSVDQVTRIIRDQVVVNHDPAKAEELLLELPGIKRFHERLKTKKEREDFRRHLRKYINIWCTDCPFEIATTNRYQIIQHEGAVVARKRIEKGETIKYLCGNLVAMTPEEEQDLDLKRRDFSIVMSSRKKTPSLFLGPARFANHDCNANAGLITTGSDGMRVVALRNIEPNQEITVTYGADYFGESNCECLCSTCEAADRNGWMSHLQLHRASAMTNAEMLPLRASKPKSSSLRHSVSADTGLHANTVQSTNRQRMSDITADLLRPERDDSPPAKRHRSASHSPDHDIVKKEVADSGSFMQPKEGSEVPLPSDGRGSSDCSHVAQSPVEPPTDNLSSNAPTNRRRNSFVHQRALEHQVTKRRLSLQDAIPKIVVPGVEGPGKPTNQSALLEGDDSDDVVLVPEHFEQEPTAQNATRGMDVPASAAFLSTTVEASEPAKSRTQASAPSSAAASVFDEESNQRSSTPVSPGNTPRIDELVAKTSLPEAHEDDTKGALGAPSPQIKQPRDSDVEPDAPRRALGPSEHHMISDLSDLSSSEDFDDSRHSIIRKPRTRSTRPFDFDDSNHARRSVSTPRTGPIAIDEFVSRTPMDGQPRRPRDYIRTPQLLEKSDSRWVDCRTCNGTFVQVTGYRTQRECERCERHSKLYGFTWPKMEKGQMPWSLGKPLRSLSSDGSSATGSSSSIKNNKRKRTLGLVPEEEQERVTDHRTVLRFIDEAEEKTEHDKEKGLAPPKQEILDALIMARKLAEEQAERAALERAQAPKRKIYGYGKDLFDPEPTPKRARSSTAEPLKSKNRSKQSGGKSGNGVAGSKVSKSSVFRRAGAKFKAALKRSAEKSKGAKAGKLKDAPRAMLTAAETKALANERKKPKKLKLPPPKEKKVPGTGRWKGWVPLDDAAAEPETEEVRMARIAAEGVGGTRRGTRIGRF